MIVQVPCLLLLCNIQIFQFEMEKQCMRHFARGLEIIVFNHKIWTTLCTNLKILGHIWLTMHSRTGEVLGIFSSNFSDEI